MELKEYNDILLNTLKIDVLSIAIEIKLFDFLEKYISYKKLAVILELDKNNTKVFLDSLVYLKLLKKKSNQYKNTSFSNKYLLTSSEYYFGDMFLFKKAYLENNKKHLFSLLKKGTDMQMVNVDQKEWVRSAKKYFFQEQKTMMADFVVELINKINKDKQIKHILDLGCSSGVLSLEVLKQNKEMNATLFDFKEVICETKKNIKKYNLTQKACTLHGDLLKDDIKDNYDLILCSNILHLLPQKEEVLQKIYTALNPNGTLLVIQSYNVQESLKNKDSYFYCMMPMMLGREPLDTYEFTNTILNSGFQSVNNFINKSPDHRDIKSFYRKKINTSN